MVFLGQASNYSAGRVLGHLFAWGTKRNSQQLCQSLAQKYQVPEEQVRLYHTGRSALAAAFLALKPEPGSKIIIPGLTCIAVVRAVRAAGCEPFFVDIDPKTLQYDWTKLAQALDKNKDLCYNGSIIVAQNTLGLPLDMQKLEKIAEKYQLRIVEDLAHSAGRFYPDSREVGTVGQAVALSFGKGKALDTIEGGALIVRSDTAKMPNRPAKRARLADTLRDRWYPLFGAIIRGGYHLGLGKIITAVLLKLHWIDRSADAELDLNHRLSHWQAKLANRQLQNLPRTPLREHYLVKDREGLLAKLAQKGFYLQEIWYDTPVAPARYSTEADFPSEECPATVKIAQSIINLPTWYPETRLAPVREIIRQYELKETL